ncbi:MAG: hypothetical protein ACLFQP_03110 [Halothece sp.]
MLRKNSPSESQSNSSHQQESSPEELIIQDKLQQLEEFLVNSANIPLTPYKFVNEEQFFQKMDQLWDSLPDAFEQAYWVLQEKENLLKQAQKEREQIIEQAQQEARQIKNQSGIIQEAQQEAYQLQVETEQNCQRLHDKTLQEIEKLRQQAYTECEELRRDADQYADWVLNNLEERLGEMLQVTQNGRQALKESQEPEPPKRQKNKRKAS